MAENERIERAFTYHPPSGNQPAYYEAVRSSAKQFAYRLDGLVPPCDEKEYMMERLQEAVMWANAAIAREYYGAELEKS